MQTQTITAANSGMPTLAMDPDEDDKSRGAGVALRDPDGRVLFVKRSMTGDQGGTWAFPGGYAHRGENEEAAAIRELSEEIGFLLQQPLRVRFDSAENDFQYTTFVHDIEPFAPVLSDESTGYVWAKPEDAPQPLHPGVDALLKNLVSGDPIGGSAMDERFAFDRATVRTTDADGRMRVSVTNISKANVCPYVGKEIPDWQDLGLQPDKIYQLLRDPDELEKGADSFNNLQLLIKHVPVSADDHQPDLVVGATGSDAEFRHPYLKNSLVVWAKDAIDAINSETQRELSSAYRYRADMTPGYYQGARYDGVMRDIIGNHVALVKEGRAGTDVVVGDSKDAVTIQQQQEKIAMSKTLLSRTATFVHGALSVLLVPKLAQDAKMPDLAPVLAKLTSKNCVEMRPALKEGLDAAFKDVKMAKDANLDDVHGFIDRLDKATASAEDEEPEEEKKKAFDAEGLSGFLKDKLSEDDMTAAKAFMGGDEGEPPEFAGKPVKEGEDEDPKEDLVDKKAMDEAIKVAVEDVTKRQQAIRTAENFVRPWVGTLALAHDSAESVHRAAAKILGIDGSDKVHPDALPFLIKAQPLPGAKSKQDPIVAMDASAIDDFTKRYPMASRIGQLG